MATGPYDAEFVREMLKQAYRANAGEAPPPPMKELNERIEREAKIDGVSIYTDDRARALYVRMPRRGRLGDIRLCDADGSPLDAMPAPREDVTGDQLLAKYRRVSDNFDRMKL